MKREQEKHWSRRRPKKEEKFLPCPHYVTGDKDKIPCKPGVLIFCSTCNLRFKPMSAEIAPGKPFSSPLINHCLFDERKTGNLMAVLEAFGRKVEDYSRHIQGGLRNESEQSQ